MFEGFKNINIKDFDTVTAAFEKLGLFPALIGAIACIIVAFFAYKIFKLAIVSAVAGGFGFLAIWLTPMITDGMALPADINIVPIAAFVFAIIGALLAMWLYKVAIFVCGAGAGYFAGTFAAAYLGKAGAGIAFFDGDIGKIIVSVVCAIVAAFILVFFYKYIYIILTSVAGMAAVGLIVGSFVYPAFALYTLIGGAVIGIIPMVYQFKAAYEM